MKTIIIKLFIIANCGGYYGGSFHYEAKSADSITYSVYSTTKYNVGDTIQYKFVGLSK